MTPIRVKPLQLTISKANEYIEESNGNKYLTLVPTDENKDTLKKYKELWNKIKDLIRSTSNNSDDCDEKYLKIKFNLGYDLPLNKILQFYGMIIVARSIFHESNKYYPQYFLDQCFCKLSKEDINVEVS